MGQLTSCSTRRARYLESETLVGRGPQCTLRLSVDYVSSQHAILRWTGESWEVWDLDSRNGTWLDGTLLQARRPHPIAQGARLCFGHLDEAWELESASSPRLLAVNLVTGDQVVVDGAVQGVPSDDAPDATLLSSGGLWVLESGDLPARTLHNGDTFEAASQVWRFCYPEAAVKTVTANVAIELGQPALRFFVSSDEEYIQLQLKLASGVVELGNRVQNHLLLTLARARLNDRAAGLPETSCGWLYKEDLVAGVEGPQRIDHDVFRIRKHLALNAPAIAESIIERRTRTRQLRIGVGALEITRR